MANAYWTGVVAGGGLLLTLVLARSRFHGPACMWRSLTGMPCPGCGMTRSLEAVWRGEFLMAFRYHPLGFIVFAVLVALVCGSALYIAVPATRPLLHRWLKRAAHPAVAVGALALLLAVWALRILDWLTGQRVFLW